MRTLRNILIIGSGLAAAACAEMDSTDSEAFAQTDAPIIMAGPNRGIPNQYIVMMKKGADSLTALDDLGITARRTFSSINGFSAELDDAQLAALRKNPNVELIEQNQIAEASVTQRNATWGLDRIDQRALPLSGTYFYGQPAFGVHAYIIDTGVQASHPNFGGRAAHVFNATGDGINDDCNGHGTHVAGTIGGATWGVAKGVFLYGVKVLGCTGSGTYEGVIAGIDWVRANHATPAVANMSLGGGFSAAVNASVNALSDSGVFVAVAAGNSNANACNFSPASAANVTTVAATASNDTKASYSNHGNCVDVHAPGSGITSTWLNGGTNTINGTSMASPHVAGVGALYKANFGDASSATVDAWIKNNGTVNAVIGNVAGTPNLLLFKSTL